MPTGRFSRMAFPTAMAESCTKGTSCGWPSATRRVRLGASAGGLSPNRWAVAGVRSVYMDPVSSRSVTCSVWFSTARTRT